MQLGERTDFLHPFIWSRVYGLMRFFGGSNKGTASNFVQITENVTETLAMIRQAFRVDRMSRTQNIQTLQDRKNETGEEQI
jgi:hypothetical protein